ncbi:hypothetical protein [Brevibacterium gallinarum]|uniref:Leucine-rich repeat domain-containing protein n=1 Tax=Brevibacterium gallinarum TaxID=2762220 RepID=A0ABR8WUL0_9MICO|nr:hypothetical protein [Brevibacterium gallinarum]MBD8020617.1 hypothetical protein [Brevibacterium gallinarum]
MSRLKLSIRRAGAVLLSVGLISGVSAAPATAASVISDPQLQACINKTLGGNREPDAEITSEDLAKVTKLDCQKMGIQSLDGMDHATNLRQATFTDNDITHFDQLTSLASLQLLNLDGNRISAIPSDVSGMTGLTFLGLHREPKKGPETITTLEPLRKLNKLSFLNIEFQQVKDLSPLLSSKDTMTTIYASSVPLQSFEPVAQMPNLQRLWASGPAGTSEALDLTPIDGLQNLDQLFLNNRALTADDIAKLTDLPKLSYLRLYDNHISDITPIEQFNSQDPYKLQAHRQTLTHAPGVVGTPVNFETVDFEKKILDVTKVTDTSGSDAGAVATVDGSTVTFSEPGTYRVHFDAGRSPWAPKARAFSGFWTIDISAKPEPSPTPTEEPSPTPTDEPSPTPTDEPSPTPTDEPSPTPTDEPSPTPTDEPSPTPTDEPTERPGDDGGKKRRLPRTGLDAWQTVGLAAVFIIVGAAGVTIARRRS